MKSPATIRDVAKRAGVAVSTASLALNGKPYVSQETRLRVLQAAEEMGYHPNMMAKNLADGRTRNLGLITPISLEHLFASSGFFVHLIRGMHRATTEHGYTLSLHIAESQDEAVSRVQTVIRGRSVDGLLITNPTVEIPYLRDQTPPHPVRLHRPSLGKSDVCGQRQRTSQSARGTTSHRTRAQQDRFLERTFTLHLLR